MMGWDPRPGLSSFFSAIHQCTHHGHQAPPGTPGLPPAPSDHRPLGRGRMAPQGTGLVGKQRYSHLMTSDIWPTDVFLCSAVSDPATPRPWQSPSRALVGDFTIPAWATDPLWQSLSRAHWDFPSWEIFQSRNLSRNPSQLQVWEEFSPSLTKVQVLPQRPLPLYPQVRPKITHYLFQPPPPPLFLPSLTPQLQSQIRPKTSDPRNCDRFPISRTRDCLRQGTIGSNLN